MPKPKLDNLLKNAKTTKKSPRYSKLPSKAMVKEMIQAWVPHFVAHSLNRETSIRAAFPEKQWTQTSALDIASKLMKNPQYPSIMQAHLDSIAEDMKIDENFVLSGLYRHAIANIMDYFEANEHGKMTLKNLSSLPASIQRNIKKVRIKQLSERESGNVLSQEIHLEIVDSQKAYHMLGTALAMFVHRQEVGIGGTLADVLEQALQREQRAKIDRPVIEGEAKRVTH